jgi:hypothetical protein
VARGSLQTAHIMGGVGHGIPSSIIIISIWKPGSWTGIIFTVVVDRVQAVKLGSPLLSQPSGSCFGLWTFHVVAVSLIFLFGLCTPLA